jgi:DNA-binding XRE family transcriptional regulator
MQQLVIVSPSSQIPPPPSVDFAKLCKEVREWLGYSQEAMASFLNVSKRTYIYWETGVRDPSARVAVWLVSRHQEMLAEQKKKKKSE